MESVAVGLVGIGLDTYWDQFAGLRERLEGYQSTIRTRLESGGASVIDVGLADSPGSARHAAEELRRGGADVVFLFVSTYALSSTVLPLAQRCACPIVVLNLQPVASIDYDRFNALGDRGLMTGEWLAHCQACCVPEIASVLGRAGVPFHLLSGHFESEQTWRELDEWVQAARVRAALRECRVGVLGHYYGGMLDVYSDLTILSASFGLHFEMLEPADVLQARRGLGEAEIVQKLAEFDAAFQVAADCSPDELRRAAKTSCALDRVARDHGLGALAAYFEGTPGDEDQDLATSLIAGASLLTASHVPVAGECEVKNAIAMKVLDLLGAGGSFSEFYLMDYKDDVVLLGHDGPAHFAIAEGRVGLVPLPVYHGKPGQGLSIQMTVKHGPVTLLSVVHRADGRIGLLVAEGESVPGPTLQIGNTNSRYRFAIGAKAFVERWSLAGPSHHCAIGVGHAASIIQKLSQLAGLECVLIG